jgi:hypothetical protein
MTFACFRVALILLGLGWNFLFIGTTSLLTRAYNDAEKFKVQSINDFLIFVTQAISQERIINDTLIEFLPSSLYAYKLGKNILKH